MFRKSVMALAIASTCASALAAVTADEAKQLGTTLTPAGAERAGNKDGSIPVYASGGLTTAPAGFKKGDGIPSRSVRERQAAVLGRCQEHGQVRGQADRGHQGPDEEVPDLPHRRVPDAPQRGVSAVRPRQHGEERHARQDRPGRRRWSRTPTAACRSRSRSTATRRCGTTCCATAATAYEFKYRALYVDASAGRSSPPKATLTQECPYYDTAKTSSDTYYKIKITYTGPARRAGEAGHGARPAEPDREGTPRVAIPARPAPRASSPPTSRTTRRIRGTAGDVDLRRRVRVQRRHGPLRLQARRQEGDARAVQQLPAGVPDQAGRPVQAGTISTRTWSAGSCTACGWSRPR